MTAAAVPWTPAEDQLLAAIVHDFADNWSLVSVILAISCGMQGVYRRPDLCRHRFKQLAAKVGVRFGPLKP